MNLLVGRLGRVGRFGPGTIAPPLGWSWTGTGGWWRGKAVFGELERNMEVSEGVFDSFRELGSLIQVHRGCPVRSPHAIYQADQVGED